MAKIYEGNTSGTIVIKGADGVNYRLKKYDQDTSDTVPLARGGTGSSTAGGARTNLGLGSIATYNLTGVAADEAIITYNDSDGEFNFTSQIGEIKAFGNISGDGVVSSESLGVRAGGNIDAVANPADGEYTITMTNAMVDSDYTVLTTLKGRSGAPLENPSSTEQDRAYQAQPVISSTTEFTIYTGGADGGSVTDLNLFEMDTVMFVVIR